jgi:hypothetical protein
MGKGVPLVPKKLKLNTCPAAPAKAFTAPETNPDPNNLAALGLSGDGDAGLSSPLGLYALITTPSGVVLFVLLPLISAIALLVIKYLSIQK